jgi:hypothetical protein
MFTFFVESCSLLVVLFGNLRIDIFFSLFVLLYFFDLIELVFNFGVGVFDQTLLEGCNCLGVSLLLGVNSALSSQNFRFFNEIFDNPLFEEFFSVRYF